MFRKVRTIHVAVNNLDKAVKLYQDNFGMEASRGGTVPTLGIKNAFLPVGEAVIELMEPLDKEQGPVSRFLKNRGEGIYMIAMEVDNIDIALKSLRERGVRIVGDDPDSRAKGLPVFIHPQSTQGILIELVEKAR
jgi:methylmalonyl-CoA/ethylmalonyl-CoA epimerase